jgi:hypothetical protein
MGFDAGDSNLYRYVNNQPTVDTDPSGMHPDAYHAFRAEDCGCGGATGSTVDNNYNYNDPGTPDSGDSYAPTDGGDQVGVAPLVLPLPNLILGPASLDWPMHGSWGLSLNLYNGNSLSQRVSVDGSYSI